MIYINSKYLLFFAAITLLVLTNGVPTFSQVTTGNIRGVVKDINNQVVPNAQITVTNGSTNVSQNANSSGEGLFQVGDLLPGDYSVSVQAANFKALTNQCSR